MPRKRLPEHLRKPVGRPAIYPWDSWFDGKPHCIRPGADFDCDIESMRQQIYQRAKAKKIRVSVRRAQDSLIVEARLNAPLAGPAAKYDWNTLLDGEVHQLRIDRDIEAKLANFRSYARVVARDRGKRLITRQVGSLLILSAVPRDAPVDPHAGAKLEPPKPEPSINDLPFLIEVPAAKPDLGESPFLIEDPLTDPRPRL